MPEIASSIVQVFIVREGAIDHQLLLLRRDTEPARGLWQPVWGHIKPGEISSACAFREAREETGLAPFVGLVEAFQLDGVHPFYIAALDTVQLSPCFLFIACGGWEPTLNHEHDAHEWVLVRRAAACLAWPGQHESVAEIVAFLSRRDTLGAAVRRLTRLDPPGGG